MQTLILKAGKERSLLRRHPWIFANAIDRVEGRPASGATFVVRAHSGQFLARAAFSPVSQIRARVWSFDEAEPIDHAFFKRRIAAATAYRRDCVEHWKEAIVAALVKETGCPNVYERSDVSVREREGLEQVTGVLAGAEPPADLSATEHGVRYYVDVREGHKTGFYVDQRDNRALVGALAKDRDVLNCFCYTGGFSLAALKGGARSVVSIDSSGEALAVAERNVTLNGFDAARTEWLDADVFKSLRNFRAEGRQFDLIVLDPPKFAASAQQVDRAARAYKEINLVGLQLLRPGGLLFTYSCSGAIDADLFQKIIAGAAADAKVTARIQRRLAAGVDHPLLTSFPEGEYLKGLLLQVG
jgi:23S rRNA (cytosine1962-C5)-methyltransferase